MRVPRQKLPGASDCASLAKDASEKRHAATTVFRPISPSFDVEKDKKLLPSEFLKVNECRVLNIGHHSAVYSSKRPC